MRYLAIDYGTKRTGLAVCDPTETIVSPLAVIRSDKGLIGKILDVVNSENIGAIVLGLPLNMDDSQGPQAKLTLKFAEKLRKSLQISVHLQDERLSSFGAQEKLFSAKLKKNELAERLDAVSAAEILGSFLEDKGSEKDAEK